VVEQQDFSWLNELNIKIRDLEERQKMLKDRVLLIGKNLVDIKEGIEESLLELKKDVGLFKQEIFRLKDSISRISEETENWARKSELEILQRQIKMFEPLRYARIEDVENIVEEILKKKKGF